MLFTLSLALFCLPAIGQNKTKSPPSKPVAEQPLASQALPTEQELDARIGELEKVANPTDTQKLELTQLRQTLSFLQKRRESHEKTIAFENSIKNAPAQLKEIEKQLAKPLEQPPLVQTPGGDLANLNLQLEAAQTQLETDRRLRNEVDQQTAYQNERRQIVPGEIAAVQQRLDEVKQQLATPPDLEQRPNLATTRRNALQTEQDYLKQRLLELDQEIRSYDTRRDLSRAQRELAERRVLVSERLVSNLATHVSNLRTEEAEKTRLAAEEARRAMADANPVVRSIAEQNEVYATELAAVSTLISNLGNDKQKVDELRIRWTKEFDSVKEKINQIGLTEAISLRLRNQLPQLPDLSKYRQRLKAHQEHMNQVQLRRLELEDLLLGLVDIEQEARELMRKAGDAATQGADYPSVLKAVQHALGIQKSDYLNELIKTYDIFFDSTLAPLHDSEHQLVDIVGEYRDFIAEHILWIQSTRRLNFNDFKRVLDAAAWLLDPARWGDMLWSLLQDAWRHLAVTVILITLLAAPIVARPRLKNRLTGLGRKAKKPYKAEFRDTLIAASLTVLIAAILPVLLWLIGWRLGGLGNTTFAAAIGAGLERVAVVMFGTELLYIMCRREGLAEAHLQWHPDNLLLARRHLSWFIPTVLPLYFIVAATDYQAIESYRDSLGRFAFIFAMIAMMCFIWIIFSPKHGIFRQIIARHTGSWLDRLQNLWFPLLTLAPLSAALAASFGYYYTALQLEQRMFYSVGLVLIIITVHALLLRWLNLTHRKMAIEQARKKLAAQAKARSETVSSEKSAQAPEKAPDADANLQKPSISAEAMPLEQELDVNAVSIQTQRLLFGTGLFTAVIGLLLIWKDVLPAFGMLREVELWSQIVTTSELVGDVYQSVDKLAPVTLADLGLALIILTGTLLLSKNIPGLLEMAVLQRLPFTPSGRFAITTTIRYLLAIVGTILAFGAIGIGWSKVQFLAAAITVGLGFGLQEIFANFVSGLIILFERPIRVGDTVTIGNISGKVSCIRIRATTITDWDRKELVIPNKEFVTGQVINWSLTDPTLRLRIPVGVAYGSDTALVTRLLLQAAHNHPLVLKDPEPQAFFHEFGDSALNFELRVFIPHLEHLWPVRHDLHTTIDRLFRENQIEISFPQHDLHIRSIDRAAAEIISTRRSN